MKQENYDRGPVLPELKGFDCADHDPIDTWIPDGPSIRYQLTLHIGSSDSSAADLFHIFVCNHAGLKETRRLGVTPGSATPIVLSEYSWNAVLEEVNRRLKKCEGRGWFDVQEKLRQQFDWEYEGKP